MLAAESARQKALPLADPPPFVYAGSFQWYNWDEKAFRPWGWGNGPWNARRQAVRENALHCRIDRSTLALRRPVSICCRAIDTSFDAARKVVHKLR